MDVCAEIGLAHNTEGDAPKFMREPGRTRTSNPLLTDSRII
jgi:hypothetical protein